MFQLINDILTEFRECFKRQRAWKWFVCIVLGFMLRGEHRGVTSMMTALRLESVQYHSILHFFRSSAYTISALYEKWVILLLRNAPLLRMSGRLVVLGDHIKISKEGRRMPCIERHHQDSQNSGKAEYIKGHNLGQVSAVITNEAQSRAIPLITELQESKTKTGGESLVEQMVALAGKVAAAAEKPVIAVLDAYFCNGSAWESADRILDACGNRLVEIVTRAKASYTAYFPPEKSGARGRPRIYGKKVKLMELFSSHADQFDAKSMVLYGKSENVRFLCIDLLWRPVRRLCRFVLVKIGKTPFVLISSDLTLSPEKIILLYGYRFKIETGFDDQKNDMGGFAYHFWSKSLPKRRCHSDTVLPDDHKKREMIESAKRASEAFVCLSIIATGILTVIAFTHSREIWNRYPGYLRTVRTQIPTLATAKLVVQQDFLPLLPLLSRFRAFSFIPKLQRSVDFLYKCA